MTWLDIVKKEDKEFEIKKEEIVKEHTIIQSKQNIYLDPTIEFEHKYNDNLMNIKFDFIDYIKHFCYPFMDNPFHLDYNIFDFMKQHSCEYSKVIDYVEQVNKDIDKEIEEEQKDLEEEIAQEEEIYDD